MSLKDIASDLATFLESADPNPAAPVTEAEFEQLGRSVVDYVLTQVEDDEPEVIGEAMVIGAQAAAQEANVSADDLVEATIRVVERMAEAMRRMQ